MTRTYHDITPGVEHIDSRDVLDEIANVKGDISWIYVHDETAEVWTGADEDDSAPLWAPPGEGAAFDHDDGWPNAATIGEPPGGHWQLEDEEMADSVDYLGTLTELLDLMAGASEDTPSDGIFAICDFNFEDYARELAEVLAEEPRLIRDARWPYSCIDWDAAAVELQGDYTSFTWGDVTYWTR